MVNRGSSGRTQKLPSGRAAHATGPEGRSHSAPHTLVARIDAEGWPASEERLVSRDDWTPPEDRQSQDADQRAPTLASYADRILAARSSRNVEPLRPSTLDNYRKLPRLAIVPELGDVRLDRITPAVVAAWHAHLPVAPTQNGNAYNLLNSIMADAELESLIERNPCRLKHAGKPAPKRQAETLDVAQLVAYLDAAPDRY